MKRLLSLLILLICITGNAQNIVIDIDDNTQNYVLLHPELSTSILVNDVEFSHETFISETYQIPAYGLYGQLWDTEHLRSQQFNIPFSNGILKIILVESYNSPFIFPCRGEVLLSYGVQPKNIFHTGIDFKLNLNDPVYACFDGVVRMVQNYGAYGKVVVIRHYNGLETVYAHLNQVKVKQGQVLKAGHIIGLAGNIGKANHVGLHFESRFLNEHFNPILLFNLEDRSLNSNILTLEPSSFYIKPIPQKEAPVKVIEKPEVATTQVITIESPEKSVKTTPPSKSEQTTDFEKVPAEYHTVQKGETLYRISLKYHVSVEELIRINNLPSSGAVNAGQRLRVK